MWTLSGIAAQICTTIPSILWVATTANVLNVFPSIADPYQLLQIVGAYLVVAPVFSIIASISFFKPKRIVSPLNIQLGTVFAFGVLVLVRILIPFTNYGYSMGTYIGFALAYGFLWIVSLAVFGILGFVQTLFVRWWIGVNLGHLEPKTFRIDSEFTKIREYIVSEDFKDFWDFHTIDGKTSPNLVRLHSRGLQNIALALAPDPENNKNSMLALLVYELNLYAVESTQDSLDLVQHIRYHLEGKFKDSIFTPLESESTVTSAVYAIAKEPTKSRFEITRDVWSRIPKYFKYAIVITLLTWVFLAPSVYYFQLQLQVVFDFDIFFELEVLIFLTFIGEIVVGARQEIQFRKKKRE